MSITRAYTHCRFGQLHYRAAGPAVAAAMTGTPVVLLHQNPSSSWEYEPLITALAQDRRVIAFDTPGLGMSESPPAPIDIASYAAAFADGIANIGLDGPFDLYGFHTGSLLAIELALALPAQARRIALTGIPMYPSAERARKFAEATDYPEPGEDGAVVLDLLGKLWNYVVVQRAPGVPIARAIRHFADKSWILDRFTWVYQAVWSYDYEPLRRLEQPILLLQPDEPLREPTLAAGRLLRDCTLRELPDLTRDIFDLAPERLADELRRFFG